MLNNNAHMVFKRLFRNKLSIFGLIIIILLILGSVFADYIAPYHYETQTLSDAYKTPCKEYWFGTDHLGRDIFSRLLYGGRISLRLGLVTVGIALFFGGAAGAVAGYKGGIIDMLIMRLMDIMSAIPSMLLAIAIAAALGAGITNALIALGISQIPNYANLVRGSVLTVKSSEYIESARLMRAGDARIIIRHCLPNVLSPLIVQATLGIGGAILSAASLSFVGLGALPPLPEWGAMLSSGREYFRDYPYMIMIPGACIMLAALSFNFLGDGLRDALDPRLR